MTTPTAQPGSTIFISDNSGSSPVPLVALRTTTMTVDGKVVDVTSRDSGGFQQLLAGAGIVKVTLKGDGIVTSDASHETLLQRCLSQSVVSYVLNWGSSHTLTCGFQISSFEAKGEYNGEQLYSITLESSGAPTVV